ncbi:MAG: O-antigen ligase family protein [Acidobacteriaceae bacterium]
MGFLLSILYLVTYYLTPATIFGSLAVYRIELILALLVAFVSLSALTKSFVLKVPQSLALIGMAIAVVLSVFIGAHWAGGAVQAFLDFIPNAFAFFLVCLHCNTKRKLQVLVLMLLFVCLFVIGNGYAEQIYGPPASTAIHNEVEGSPYLMAMGNSAGQSFFRLRGLGEINDPNDFGQLLVCVIPLMFIFWRAKKMLRNCAFVILPVCALLFGLFLTHSRGALLALMAVAIVASRRRIGTLPSLLLAGAGFVAASALHFTGGRDISEASGADRISLWGQGLQVFKAHPLFGVGFGQLPDYTDVHLTAHNSIVLCAAELGFFGLYFWCLFLFPTMRDALAVASPEKVTEADPIVPEEGPFPQMTRKLEALDKSEVNRLGRLLVLSFTGYFVAAWFLSRAYIATLFLLGGMAEVVFQMALQRGMIAPRLRLARTLPYAGILAISLILVMYVSLRVMNLTR